jgi:hypothetical protein
MRVAWWVWLVVLVGGAWLWQRSAEPAFLMGGVVERPDGTLTFRPLDGEGVSYRIEPVERFRLEARVLGTRRYRMGRESELSPIDLALGWGPMREDTLLRRLRISQGGRFFYVSWDGSLPVPASEVIHNSSNMHMIPADADVWAVLRSLREGDEILLDGHLVDVQASDGWRWLTSRIRTDTGPGACELVYVESIRRM